MSTDLLRSLHGHVYALLDRFSIPVDKEPLRQALAAIQQEVDPGAVSRSLRALLEREFKAAPCPPEALARRTAASLAGALGQAYRGHVGRYLVAVNWRQPPGQPVEEAVASLDQDLVRRVLPLALAAAMNRESACQSTPLAQPPGEPAPAQPQPTPQPAAAPPAHPLLDAFGRGLLLPVEARYPILGQEGIRRGVPGFPRVFCAPVLAEIKFRLIGDDKYNTTNAKFIESIRKHCHVEGQLDRTKLREYFQFPAVRQYLNAYSLHLLKHLMDEGRREIFQANVNVRLRKNVAETSREFTDMYMAILTSSWALFVFENLDAAHRGGAVGRILRHYIPGKMDDAGA